MLSESLVILSVVVCSSNNCNSFEPYSWDASEPYAVEIALEECSVLSKAYDQLHNVADVGCYFSLPDDFPASEYQSDENGKAMVY